MADRWRLADIQRQPQISAVGSKADGRSAAANCRYCRALFFFVCYVRYRPGKVSRREGTHDDFTSTTCCPLRHSRLG